MKKNHVRYHATVSNKVASVYIDEVYAPQDKYMKLYDTKYRFVTNPYIHTRYYEYIAICVSNNRRTNNDWYNGDRIGNRLHNKSTGNIHTLIAIANMLEEHIVKFINQYGYYCCMFEPTDERREKTYIMMMNKLVKKHCLIHEKIVTVDGSIVYILCNSNGMMYDCFKYR